PYSSPFERAQVDEANDAVEREIGLWDEATTKRYWAASGGEDHQFAGNWHNAMVHRVRVAEAIRAKAFSSAGGTLLYLVWGWRAVAP
ncbi:MAG: hypothetical protein ABJA82_08495, partial [Myxococcales bacterium]